MDSPGNIRNTQDSAHLSLLLIDFHSGLVESSRTFLLFLKGASHLLKKRASYFECLPMAADIPWPLLHLISLNFKLFECFPTCNLNTSMQRSISLGFGWNMHEFVEMDSKTFKEITFGLQKPIPPVIAKCSSQLLHTRTHTKSKTKNLVWVRFWQKLFMADLSLG